MLGCSKRRRRLRQLCTALRADTVRGATTTTSAKATQVLTPFESTGSPPLDTTLGLARVRGQALAVATR